jgi:hypothetical protein
MTNRLLITLGVLACALVAASVAPAGQQQTSCNYKLEDVPIYVRMTAPNWVCVAFKTRIPGARRVPSIRGQARCAWRISNPPPDAMVTFFSDPHWGSLACKMMGRP